MSGHSFGSMLWGFLFWVGFLINILLFVTLVAQQFISNVVIRWTARILGGIGVFTGLYLALAVIPASSLSDAVISFLTGLPATAIIMALFGSPAILGGFVIWRSL